MSKNAPKSLNEVKLESMVDDCLRKHPNINNKGHALVYLCLKSLKHYDDDIIFESLTDGGNDLGVDFLVIDENNFKTEVLIISTRWFEKENKKQSPFPSNELDKIRRFVSHLKNEDTNIEKTCNERLREKIQHLRMLMTHKVLAFEYWNVSNAELPNQVQISALTQDLNDYGIKTKHLHREQIASLLVSDSVNGPQRLLKVDPNASTKITRESLPGIVGIIKASDLCSLLESPLFPNEPDPSLFAKNIRGFLGLTGDVNREIVRSTRKANASFFWAKNNGLTMVARAGDYQNVNLSGLIEIKGLSILNGAQTCSALFDQWLSAKQVGEDLDHVEVVFKLIFTNDEELIYNLTLTTNTQNRIRPRDIMANDELQLKLEKQLSEIGINYERRAGELETYDDAPTISSTLAGQLILATVHCQPHKAKTQTDEIFGNLHNQIFSSVDINRLLRSSRIYSRAQILGNEYFAGLRKLDNQVPTSFIPYSYFHVVAISDLLLQQDESKFIDETIAEAFNRIARNLVGRGTSPYEFFRSPKRAEDLLNPITQRDLFEDIKTL